MAGGCALVMVVVAVLAAVKVEGYTKTKQVVSRLEVQLQQGPVWPAREEAGQGRVFYSLKGIPYAKPPIGDLRFKDPVPAEGWLKPLDGSVDPPLCPQFFRGNVTGSEDCLFVNVYTPAPDASGLPVMVWLHGGAFKFGGGKYYPPLPLLTKDIVLVVVQFRLGALGFLSTEDSVMPGNLGLKDQTLALRWVRDNIRDVGGDPARVTLFGESAGAASIQYQMMVPQAKGLFSRAILQSGAALCPWALREDHRQVAIKVGHFFNCSTTDTYSRPLDSGHLLACLQQIPFHEFVHVYSQFYVWNSWPWVMMPRVDGVYLPEHPATLLRTGRYHKQVDIISGITQDDGGLFSLSILINKTKADELEETFPVAGPVSLFIGGWEESPEYLARRAYYHYLGGTKITQDKTVEFTQMLTDRFFRIDHEEMSEFHAVWGASTGHRVFKYELQHRAEHGFADRLNSSLSKDWVVHGDDMLYLFNIPWPAPGPLAQPADLFLRDIILTLWTNFAATGNPTPDGSLGFRWCPTTESQQWYLALTTSPAMKHDTHQEVLEFWKNMPTKKNMLLYPERFVENRTCPAAGSCGGGSGQHPVNTPQDYTQQLEQIIFNP